MDIKQFLSEITTIEGLPGREQAVAERIAQVFTPLADDVRIDQMGNVIARYGQGGPRIQVAAHMDEIGLVVSQIEEDGSLRMERSGGVDPRILPASEVHVHTKGGKLVGIVGAKPPHLLTPAEQKKALLLKDMYVDLGMSAEHVKQKVRIGDMITLVGEATELMDGHMASKTMDDRAGVAVMLCALEQLRKMRAKAETHFVSTVQEEIGSRGAKTSAHALDCDIAIAIDVTHGEGPGTGKWEAYPLNKIPIGKGPSLHPVLHERIMQIGKKHHMDCVAEISNGTTYTDADPMHMARAGVPCVLISVPLRYMHTTVETLNLNTIEEAGRLIALFIDDITSDWEAIQWF